MRRKLKASISLEAKREVEQCWKDAIDFTNNLEIHSLVNNDRLYQSFVEIMSEYHRCTDRDSTTVHGLVRTLFSDHPNFLRAYHSLCATRLFSVPNPLNPNRVDDGSRKKNDIVIQEPKAKRVEKRPSDDNEPKAKSVKKRPRDDNYTDVISTRASRTKICTPTTTPIAIPRIKIKVNFNPIGQEHKIQKDVEPKEKINISSDPQNCEEQERYKDFEPKEKIDIPSDPQNGEEPQKKKAGDGIEIPTEEPELREGQWRPEPCTPSYRFLEEPCGPSKAVDDSDPVNVLNNTCAIAICGESSYPIKTKEEKEYFKLEDTRYYRSMKLHTDPRTKENMTRLLDALENNRDLYERMIRTRRAAWNRLWRPINA